MVSVKGCFTLYESTKNQVVNIVRFFLFFYLIFQARLGGVSGALTNNSDPNSAASQANVVHKPGYFTIKAQHDPVRTCSIRSLDRTRFQVCRPFALTRESSEKDGGVATANESTSRASLPALTVGSKASRRLTIGA